MLVLSYVFKVVIDFLVFWNVFVMSNIGRCLELLRDWFSMVVIVGWVEVVI